MRNRTKRPRRIPIHSVSIHSRLFVDDMDKINARMYKEYRTEHNRRLNNKLYDND